MESEKFFEPESIWPWMWWLYAITLAATVGISWLCDPLAGAL